MNIKKIKGISVDVRSKNSLYITINDWIIYIDNSTNEKIVNHWEEKNGKQYSYVSSVFDKK
tara:strand:+ start:1146 stop:1328 length:183 start_codon:yes stop_codon:yes gene_type:complete